MTKGQSLVFKFFILLFGLAVIFASYIMFASTEHMSSKEQYLWINIPIIYLILMLPSLFYTITLGSFDRRIVPVMTTYFTSLMYAIVAVVLIVVVTKMNMPIKVAAMIQLILLFILAIELYIAFFTGSHIAGVATKEKQLLSRIMEIKKRAQILKRECGSIEKLDDKRECMSIMENLTFLSPANNQEAFSLEVEIIEELNALSSLLSTGYDEKALKAKMSAILSLYNRRKLMIN